jgi:circadian clock protein KaiB
MSGYSETGGRDHHVEIAKDICKLRLYAAGASVNSVKAIENVKGLCEEYLKDMYELEIIDIYQQPLLAQEDQIIALPLLIRKYPLPERRFVGDMSNIEVIIKGLDIKR